MASVVADVCIDLPINLSTVGTVIYLSIPPSIHPALIHNIVCPYGADVCNISCDSTQCTTITKNGGIFEEYSHKYTNLIMKM